MNLDTAIPEWWVNPQKLFDIFKDAGLELLLSVVFGLVGFALFRMASNIPWFGDGRGVKNRTRMWIPGTVIPPVVGFFSAWRYHKFMTPAEVPVVKIDPGEYIFLMTLVVAVVPGFIVMPIMTRFMKKRGATGQTTTLAKDDA